MRSKETRSCTAAVPAFLAADSAQQYILCKIECSHITDHVTDTSTRLDPFVCTNTWGKMAAAPGTHQPTQHGIPIRTNSAKEMALPTPRHGSNRVPVRACIFERCRSRTMTGNHNKDNGGHQNGHWELYPMQLVALEQFTSPQAA